MATFKAVKYAEGSDYVGSWFNSTNSAESIFPNPYFDISDWAEYASTQSQNSLIEHHDNDGDGTVSPEEAATLWKLNKNAITFTAKSTQRFFEGDELVRTEVHTDEAIWKGNFVIEGDRITDGYVNSFERDWGGQGTIEINGFNYPVREEAFSFAALTLPEAITDYIEENLDFLSEGETYNFQTKYDDAREPSADNVQTSTLITLPTTFNKKSADKIINFNPSIDTLEVNADSFGIDSSATFASGKNKKAVKKKLAKQDIDFLYDQKKGGLYFNENGSDKGFGDGGIIAILKGAPDLTSGNLEFI